MIPTLGFGARGCGQWGKAAEMAAYQVGWWVVDGARLGCPGQVPLGSKVIGSVWVISPQGIQPIL